MPPTILKTLSSKRIGSILDYEDWVQILSQHPIFQCEVASTAAVDIPDGGYSTIPHRQMAMRGTDLLVAIGSEIRVISLKACKDACIRFKAGSQSLMGDNNSQLAIERKQKAVRAVPFKILRIPGIDFYIRQLISNPNDDLMAVVGENDVVVMSLPRPAMIRVVRSDSVFRTMTLKPNYNDTKHSATMEVPVVDCRLLHVGEAEHPDGPKSHAEEQNSRRRSQTRVGPREAWSKKLNPSSVAKVLWHPASLKGTHILVLYRDGTIKMYDVAQSVDYPEQVFSIKNTMQSNSPYQAIEAVSFSFGHQSSNSDWGRVTLYITTSWGDIYALCPVVPGSWSADKVWLERMYQQSLTDVREHQGEEYDVRRRVSVSAALTHARQKEQWLYSALLSSKSLGNTHFIHISALDTNQGDAFLRQPLPQGPFLLQPEPPETSYSCTSDSDSDSCSDKDVPRSPSTTSSPQQRPSQFNDENACDIIYLNTDPVGILGLAYGSGRLDLFVDLEPVSAAWPATGTTYPHSREARQSLPVLVTLETIETRSQAEISTLVSRRLSLGHTFRIPGHLVSDPEHPRIMFYAHECGIHSINLQKWVDYFSDALLKGTNDMFGSNDEKVAVPPFNSETKCLINTRPANSK